MSNESDTRQAVTATPVRPAVAAARQRMNPQLPPPRPKITIKTGKVNGPRKFVIYGMEKVGKSTFLDSAPNAVVIATEPGYDELGTARIECSMWEEVIAGVQYLIDTNHGYETMGIDSLDWAEKLLEEFVCRRANKRKLSDFEWGGGYKEMLVQWRELLSLIETLQRKKKMNVVVIAHVVIKEQNNPMGENFDRYVIKLYDKATALFREWCSLIGFAAYETVTLKGQKKGAKAKGQATGARVLYTEHQASFDAGNRYRMPPKMPLDWNEVFNATKVVFDEKMVTNGAESAAKAENNLLRSKITKLLPNLPEEKRNSVSEWLNDTDLSTRDLQMCLNKMLVILSDMDSDDDYASAEPESTPEPVNDNQVPEPVNEGNPE